MKLRKKLLSFLLIHVMLKLAETGNPPCSNEECYILLERDLNNTQQQITGTGNYLELASSQLTATLQLLNQTRDTVDDTFMYANQLNMSESQLSNIFNSVRAGLASTQQQIYNLSDLLTSIRANATITAMMSNDVAATANQTIDHIIMAIDVLDQLEDTVLPMLDSVAMYIAEQTDNGTALHAELMVQFELVTSQASQLFNVSQRSLSIINAAVKSLMNSSALQNSISDGVRAQEVIRDDVSDQLDTFTNNLAFIQQLIQFYSVYISEETDTFSLASMEQINQELQDALQLTIDAKLLLRNISMLIYSRHDLYTILASYEARYRLLPDQVEGLVQEALRLYNHTVLVNLNAKTASEESNQLVADAQYLQTVLQNFSAFVDTTSELLENIDAIQTSAVETINTANTISSMIMATYQTVNDSLLVLMESSNLVDIIETTLSSWSAEVTDAVETTQDLDIVQSSITSLETGQMAIDNIARGFTSQQEYINDTEADIETTTRIVYDATYSCNNASASVIELQSQLDNLRFLSYEDIAEVRNRITQVELGIDDIQNMMTILTDEITQQRLTIGMLEYEIAEIITETDTLTALYNSLPQSCDEDI